MYLVEWVSRMARERCEQSEREKELHEETA
jgi:hypothetical protein